MITGQSKSDDTSIIVSVVVVIVCTAGVVITTVVLSISIYLMYLHQPVRIIKFPKRKEASLTEVLKVFEVRTSCMEREFH